MYDYLRVLAFKSNTLLSVVCEILSLLERRSNIPLREHFQQSGFPEYLAGTLLHNRSIQNNFARLNLVVSINKSIKVDATFAGRGCIP